MKIESMIDKIADGVLSDLTGRSGFDAFWSEIDSGTRQEIREAIGRNALEAMREPTVEMVALGESSTRLWASMVDAALDDK